MAGFLEIFGLILAFMDFWNLSRYLERAIDWYRERLRASMLKLFSGKGRAAFGGLLKFGLFMAIVFILVALTFSSDRSKTIVDVLTAVAILIVPPSIAIFGPTVLYWVMHVLNLPPSGTVGSIGLIVTLLGCMLDYRSY
ncbi:MAG: hypothetical protein ACYS3N_18140 [Planctomycetota bacterium]